MRGAGDDGSDATGSAEHSDAEDDDAETVEDAAIPMLITEDTVEDAAEHPEDVAEHTEGVEQADLGADNAAMTVASENESKTQIFQVTISLRDDWLHRGDALQDMDLQTYAEYIERRLKPIRGDDSAKVLRDRIFAFDPHYKLAAAHMQVLQPASRRKIARFIMARCEKENVNEGEENAQFKAMHCTLLRCPGPGSCADPLMCAAALFPNAQNEYRFRPAWRARESEIKTLAWRGYEKKYKARRFEALYDTTLCKVWQSTAEPDSGEPTPTPEARAASKMLQVDLQRWFRQLLRRLRVDAQPESPCNYGLPLHLLK